MTERRDLIRRYTLSVTIERPVESEPWAELDLKDRQREGCDVERELLKVLRKVEGDADVECMGAEDIEEAVDPRVKGDDDGKEYADPRDAREDR